MSHLSGLPLLLAFDGSVLSLASPESADYALIMVRDRPFYGKPVVSYVSVRGETVVALKMSDMNGRTLVYALLSTLNQTQPGACSVAGVSLLAGKPLLCYSSEERKIDLATAFANPSEKCYDRASLRSIVQQCVLGSGSCVLKKWSRSRVTGEHHTLLRPEEVVAGVKGKLRVRLVAAAYSRLKKYDETEAFASGVLLWSATAEVSLVQAMVESDSLWEGERSVSAWARRAKSITADLKAHQHYTDMPLEQAFELQVLANRGIGGVDWKSERSNRTRPTVVELPRGLVFDQAKTYFSRSTDDATGFRSEGWDDFWSRRWANTPGGSVHSQYSEDVQYISDLRPEKTKQYTVTSMPEVGINHFLSRPPEICAWASSKYEWAKERAIYGTDLTSYLLTDFAMPAVEESLSNHFPVGRKANEYYVGQRVKLAGEVGVAMCFDYEDFNSQHSLQSMYEVVDAYLAVFGPSMSSEQEAAMRWVRRSVLSQRVVSSESGQYVLRGTLLSGWRLTTVVNTVLNKVYLDLAGCTRNFTDSVHNGDDVLAYTHTVKDAVEVLRKAREAGIRAQPSKCAIGGLQEFLRVDRAATRVCGAQYLTRGCATAVHARAESSEPESLYSALEAAKARIDELVERGCTREYADTLWGTIAKRAEMRFSTAPGTAAIYLSTHRVAGGLADDPEVEPEWNIESRETGDIEEKMALEMLRPGIKAYANYVVRKFGLSYTHAVKAVKNIAYASARTITLSRPVVTSSHAENRALVKRRQYLHKVCKNEYAAQARTGKGRLAGLPVGRLAVSKKPNMALVRISISKDPLKTMSVIF